MLFTATIPLLAALVAANPVEIQKRVDCPMTHIFAAREENAPPGYGLTESVVNMIIKQYPKATAEAIDYPACSGQDECGGANYLTSSDAGITAVVNTLGDYNRNCPDTQIILVGYGQGAAIMDYAICGNRNYIGGRLLDAVKAAIFMGDPVFFAGMPYNTGTCAGVGLQFRESCHLAALAKIQSYCDYTDPICCKGDDADSHLHYAEKYGGQAIRFLGPRIYT